MSFYGPTWNNANRVMPDSGKRKVNIAIYGTERHDHTPSPVRPRSRTLACDRQRLLRTHAPRVLIVSPLVPHLAQEEKAEQFVSALREHVGASAMVNLCSPPYTGLLHCLRLLLCVQFRQAANVEEHSPCVTHATVCHAYAAHCSDSSRVSLVDVDCVCERPTTMLIPPLCLQMHVATC